MDDRELSMLYPTIEVIGHLGMQPRVYLPEDFEERVPAFYEQGRKQGLEDYVETLRELNKENPSLNKDIYLLWDEELGLTSIGIGPSTGLDLNNRGGWPNFQTHNLGANASLLAGLIAQKYVSELIKSSPKP